MGRPDGLLYTSTHEWVRIEDGIAVIGITDHAVDALGDLAFVDLPEVGAQLKKSVTFGEIESTKAASELYAPLGGEVVEVHDELVEDLHQITDSPFESGWLIKIRFADASEIDSLLAESAYDDYLKQEEH